VGTWNNYFLPLIMLSDPKWYPLTVGLNQWSEQANTAGGEGESDGGERGEFAHAVPPALLRFHGRPFSGWRFSSHCLTLPAARPDCQ
jgi:hypothetical protein